MKEINFNSIYDIIVGNNILNKIDLNSYIIKNKILIISDDIVWNIYKNKISNLFKSQNLDFFSFIIPHGEKSKSLNIVNQIYNILYQNNFIRTDYLIALGGGVIGDISGFVASTYMRGINLINIPTTLISQVDSSIGGKTGLNFKSGKNLIGTFYNPKLVICDINFLETLDKRQFSSGVAEIIKYSLIKDKSIKGLLNNINENLEVIILKCINIKKDIVLNDTYDQSERKILNFGHTIGHALEASENFTNLLHGEAIGLGMLMITKAATKNNLSSSFIYDEIYRLLQKFHLPISWNLDINEILDKIILDKKRSNNIIDLIIVKDLENPIIYPLPLKDIKKFFVGPAKLALNCLD